MTAGCTWDEMMGSCVPSTQMLVPTFGVAPTPSPTGAPTPAPTPAPNPSAPTPTPAPNPSPGATGATGAPTATPTRTPTREPTSSPTPSPTDPTPQPSAAPFSDHAQSQLVSNRSQFVSNRCDRSKFTSSLLRHRHGCDHRRMRRWLADHRRHRGICGDPQAQVKVNSTDTCGDSCNKGSFPASRASRVRHHSTQGDGRRLRSRRHFRDSSERQCRLR